MTEVVVWQARYRPTQSGKRPVDEREDRSGLSPDWIADVECGLDALDFEIFRRPGEPTQMEAVHARPPEEAQAYRAMVAASQFSNVLALLAGVSACLKMLEARRLQRELIGAQPDERARFANLYRTMLGKAFKRYLAGAETEQVDDLTAWYESNRKAVDG